MMVTSTTLPWAFVYYYLLGWKTQTSTWTQWAQSGKIVGWY
jgi:hypothetical protein